MRWLLLSGDTSGVSALLRLLDRLTLEEEEENSGRGNVIINQRVSSWLYGS